MRDLDPNGVIEWSGLVTTSIDGRKSPDLLSAGDVVFASRGLHNYAVCLDDVPARTVCSQHFFLLRVKNDRLLPQFLAWQINRAPAQRYFAKHAEGSAQLSIRRAVLEALSLAVPPLDYQQRIIDLHRHAQAERALLENLIRNRERQLDALACALFAEQSNHDDNR
ncbi:restriction endonuclease subunit S [Ralstonia sp. RL]|uniref:restriction endonuclease subunit S n=1 Tax=Ralstonia sp. RL TaxID=1839756 RepID=UPI00257BB746|nr:restriction endonuclease subunit S [Ralstonia sp. RL]